MAIVCTACGSDLPDLEGRPLATIACENGHVGNWQHAPSTEEDMAASLRAVALKALSDGIRPNVVTRALEDVVAEIRMKYGC